VEGWLGLTLDTQGGEGGSLGQGVKLILEGDLELGWPFRIVPIRVKVVAFVSLHQTVFGCGRRHNAK
jgi:hypothetical protein